ncbi:MAG: asparagine synthase (glutamine-hydrolyzing) [Lachnospiraceae bacterium]|nr:asparagine synthase (glutamine-hydrolyzing) [Lachnospiraceae bacterium]MBQ7782246.1 asparagine synthase (glutamine-hydrolyzing) [Lachnospiraceae bacterium]
MCGICGFVSKDTITIEQLKEMNDTMYHRGPDDSGEEIYPAAEGYTVGFAQRRLSILDLSPLGHQPMHSKDKRISVVYNGEIYNFQELKEELRDYAFTSTCDTEVIIAAYLKWGIDCINKFNGMFAIALFDRETQDVYLVRDRIGKKPLYYWSEAGNLVFASEMKPIMACPGFEKKIRTEVISRYLYHQYINAPDTIFENVYKLEPGSVLKFHAGEIKCWKYWDVKEVYHAQKANPVKDYNQAKEELKALLNRSVALRMIADVPLGTFLSGGYDSSLMTAIAQSQSDQPVKTYSIGFNEEKYNEAKFAKEVANYLGTNHTEVYIGEKEMFDLVDSIPAYYDEPFADSSQIPSMLVAELARKDVTVVLSGDGGDEFFCGYNAYDKVGQAQKLDFLGGLTYGACNLPGIKQAKILDKMPFKVRIIAGNRNKETKTQFGASSYHETALGMVKGEAIPILYEIESGYAEKNWQERRMLLDMDTYLPGDILCKVDRATMKYSLEARCPILDKDVMEYSYRLPHSFKYGSNIKKRILKDIAYDYIPRELLDRPKVGFGVPLDKWLRGPLKEKLLAMADRDFLIKQDIFDADFVCKMMQTYMEHGDGGPATGANYSKLMWSYFVFQQWYSVYMK